METQQTKSLVTPSGNTVVIRQQNGDDDDILSNGQGVQDGTSITKFLSEIIIESSYGKGKLTPQEVSLIRLPDIYFILISSRIFSIGADLTFQYNWQDLPSPVEYTEDLGQFVWDYNKEFPSEPSDKDYFEFRIKPISKELTRQITLSSGKVLEYTYMNANGEKYLLSLPVNKQSKNQEMFARKLRQKTSSGWMDVHSFKFFSPLEMAQIRNDIQENDPVLEIFSEIQHPDNTQPTVFYPILASMDFFFPRQIF